MLHQFTGKVPRYLLSVSVLAHPRPVTKFPVHGPHCQWPWSGLCPWLCKRKLKQRKLKMLGSWWWSDFQPWCCPSSGLDQPCPVGPPREHGQSGCAGHLLRDGELGFSSGAAAAEVQLLPFAGEEETEVDPCPVHGGSLLPQASPHVRWRKWSILTLER